MAIEADLDEMAYYVFEEFKLDEATQAVVKENGELTKFGNYLNDGLITQKTVSKKTNITVNKLSLLANDGEITLFARDVFLTALATKRKPSTGFLAVSGHLQLNSPERQEELRLEYEAKLAAAKANVIRPKRIRNNTCIKSKSHLPFGKWLLIIVATWPSATTFPPLQ